MNLIKSTLLISILTLISCNDSKNEKAENLAETITIKNSNDTPIVLTIDGKTRSISADEREADVANLDESPIRYLFRKRTIKGEKSQFEIDFVFSDKENLFELPKTYDLTEDPSLHSIASLSFFDFERKVEKSSNKRLVFDKGIITVFELNKDKIHFEYEGEVYELMNNQNRATVSGRVNVNY